MRKVGSEEYAPRVQVSGSNLQRALATFLLAFNPAARLQVRSKPYVESAGPRLNLASTNPRRIEFGPRYPVAPKTRSSIARMNLGGPSFFGLGTSEAVVIGLAAYFLLGPKELYKLAKQAGGFLGEWRKVGLDAQRQFQDAMDAEEIQNPLMDVRNAVNEFQSAAYTSQFPKQTSSVSKPSSSESTDSPDATKEAFDDLAPGVPSAGNSVPDDVGGLGTSDVQVKITKQDTSLDQLSVAELSTEETRLGVEMEQAENELQTLRAEAEILRLKRKQVEAVAVRTRREREVKELEELEKAQESPDPNVKVSIKKPGDSHEDVGINSAREDVTEPAV